MLTAIDFLIESIKSSKSVESVTKSNISRFPCGICNHEVKHNDKALHCTICLHKVHIRCNSITIDEYKLRLERNNDNPEQNKCRKLDLPKMYNQTFFPLDLRILMN